MDAEKLSAVIKAMAPKVGGAAAARQKAIVQAVAPQLAGVFAGYAIDTPLRVVHCLAQMAHESDGFCTTEEYADGKAYEGRKDLGNSQPGDGPRYKGRGLIQLTGRANYHYYGGKLGLPLEDYPEMAAEPVTSLRIACEYWAGHAINAVADTDDLIVVTALVNGGVQGIGSRWGYYDAAVAAMKTQGFVFAAAAHAYPVLLPGSLDVYVVKLQYLLQNLAYPGKIDRDYGPTTQKGVEAFKTSHQLKGAGVTEAVWKALEADNRARHIRV